MNCDDFRELISERVASELSGEQTKEFDAHQQVCSACRDAVRDWQQLESLLRSTWPSLWQSSGTKLASSTQIFMVPTFR